MDYRSQVDPGVVLIRRQRPQQRPLLLEVEADRGGPTVDVAGVLLGIDRRQALVQLRQ
ncbi:hypothetical protein ACFYXM_12930 [Streptomyces sp. NPDC002476]|uniref:hypothetical protein n=1 Tax=Streptomyces sp. NPDC002476 TaxID=3364648 RepID=UPI0036A84A46